MASWVRNVLTIAGDKKEIESFLAFLKQDGHQTLDFNVFIPMPEELQKVSSPVNHITLAVGEYLVRHTLGALEVWDKWYGEDIKKTMCKAVGKDIQDCRCLMKEYLACWEKEFPDQYEEKQEKCKCAYKNLIAYGYSNAFDWRRAKWGTHTNAEEATPLEDLLPFYDNPSKEWYVKLSFQTAWSIPTPMVEYMVKRFTGLSFTLAFSSDTYGVNTGWIKYKKDRTSCSNWYTKYTRAACEHSLEVWGREDLKNTIREDSHGAWHVND